MNILNELAMADKPNVHAEDIELKRAEFASRENEFRLLAEALPQIVWTTRADGWNIFFNQK